MKKILSLARRDLLILFNTPAAYGVLLFYVLAGSFSFIFLQSFFIRGEASLEQYFVSIPFIFFFTIPAITMNSWAEEYKTSSVDLLFALPFSPLQLVLGKFFASVGFLLVMLFSSLPLILSVLPLGDFELGLIFMQLVGTFLFGISLIALGQFISLLTKSSILSYLLSLVAILVMNVAHVLAPYFLGGRGGWLELLLRFFSLQEHYSYFSKGVFNSQDALFFIILAGTFLFLTQYRIIAQKWR